MGEIKQKRYWLRGGLVGELLGIIIFWIFMLSISNLKTGVFMCSQLVDRGWCNDFSEFIFSSANWISAIVIFGIPCLLIGALIGYIYGKIKNRGERK